MIVVVVMSLSHATPEPSPAITGAWGLMLRSVLELLPYFTARCSDLDLTATQGNVVLRLGTQPMIMRQLADALAYDPSTITGVVDRLQDRGLVQRERQAGDRRAWALALTDAGHATRIELLDLLRAPAGPFALLSRDQEQRLWEALLPAHRERCLSFPSA
jgi:DNA-binding MarR family transcriptional regulator